MGLFNGGVMNFLEGGGLKTIGNAINTFTAQVNPAPVMYATSPNNPKTNPITVGQEVLDYGVTGNASSSGPSLIGGIGIGTVALIVLLFVMLRGR